VVLTHGNHYFKSGGLIDVSGDIQEVHSKQSPVFIRHPPVSLRASEGLSDVEVLSFKVVFIPCDL